MIFAANSPEYLATNWLSILSTSAVVAVCLWLRFVSNVRRASLMLQAAVSLVDLMRHIRLLFNTIEDEGICAGVAALSFFGDHLSMLLNVAIAANLHCVFLKGRMPGALWHRLLWLLPITVALGLDLLPMTMDVYGKANGLCFIRSEHPYRLFFKVFLLYGTLYVGLVYCLVVAVLVYRKALSQLGSCLDAGAPAVDGYNRVVLYFAMRIALYPLSCFLSQAGFMAVTVASDVFGFRSAALFSVALFLQSTTGVVNLVCLCFDPSLARLFGSCLPGQARLHEPVYTCDDSVPSTHALPCDPTTTKAGSNLDDVHALKRLLDHL